ncbi:MAG: hypothetical protein WBF47_15615 [Xanthobacteraceae bacterium]
MTKPSSKLTDIILARARAAGLDKAITDFPDCVADAARAEASKVWIVGVAIAFNYGTPVPSDIAYFIENSLLFRDRHEALGQRAWNATLQSLKAEHAERDEKERLQLMRCGGTSRSGERG